MNTAMKVETFEQVPVDASAVTEQQTAEAVALCESLGLKGQLKKSDDGVVTQIPYRTLTQDESFVYFILCPEKVSVTDYSKPLPLEILKTIAYVRTLDLPELAYLEVWDRTSAMVKDPVLIGRKTEWSGENYLLARWGEELLPLGVLLPDALRIFNTKYKQVLKQIKHKVEQALLAPDHDTVPGSAPSYPIFYL